MYWVGTEGKVLKVEHTEAFEHNKESHLFIVKGEIDGDDGICVRQNVKKAHTLRLIK